MKRKTKEGLRGGTFYSLDSEEETKVFILSVSVMMTMEVSLEFGINPQVSWDMVMVVVKGEEDQTIEEGLDLW